MDTLPQFPKTPHIPRANLVIHPNDDDIVASSADLSPLSSANLVVEEKLDGANCGMSLYDGHPAIRNRRDLLRKGDVKKNTSAKIQFRRAWNWFYDNKKKFERLNEIFGHPVGVYGEWLLALHGIVYNELPSFFVAYDIYDPEKHWFIDPVSRRESLTEAGFENVPLLHTGPVDFETLVALTQQKSSFGNDLVEGVYVKVWETQEGPTTHRFKMIRDGYAQGCNWSNKTITKQELKKAH